ncbi:hypothetical protein [Shewanella dokdonensis]|uniref:hypothetical protein n=1 Tax=Shewanella dokdonensis TaxID=712036 RepID=UPI00200E29D0|nr:hypothetical protein [Shewanella dokdonensis]MCL1074229.1 hypothetical protein [Shewanella dokdonensis]
MTEVITLLEKLATDSTLKNHDIAHLLSISTLSEPVKKAVIDHDIEKLKEYLLMNSSRNCPIQIATEDDHDYSYSEKRTLQLAE